MNDAKAQRLRTVINAKFSSLARKSVLEVGCGMGTMASDLLESGALYTGIDTSDVALEKAKARYPTGVFLQYSNIVDFSLGTKYDIVFCDDISVGLVDESNWRQALRNMKEHLNDGGVIIINNGIVNEIASSSPQLMSRGCSQYQDVCDGLNLRFEVADSEPGLYYLWLKEEYRFPKQKDASWNSYNRHVQRYQVIKHLLGQNAVGAEIGVYKGGFGEFLRQHCKRLYLVDPWYRLKPYWGIAKPENSAVRAFINILQVYADEIERGTVHVVAEFSVPFLLSLPGAHLDWIYLDASHTYEDTAAELHASMRVVRKGGYIIGDDYDPDPSSKQHGVFLAVNEIVKDNGFVLCVNTGRQWAFQMTH